MRTLLTLLAVLPVLGSGPQDYNTSEKEEIRKTLQFPGGGSTHELVIDNITGNIEVTGYDGNEIQLVARRTSYGWSEEKVQESKQKITLDINEEPGKIILYVNTPWRCGDGVVGNRRNGGSRQSGDYGFDADFDFELKVPSKTDFFLKTVNKGTIRVVNMNGKFEVSNVNGAVEMTDIAGAGLATTVNGSVEVRFRENPESKCGFRTVNGDIEVQVPGELSANLKLKTFNGDVYTDFDVTGLPRQSPSVQKMGRRTVYHGDEFFAARAGKGGPEMLFDTLNGDIRILRTHN